MILPAHRTKIVCTIGPVSRSEAVLERLMLLGVNVARLKRISNEVGKIQVIYGGKAHPRDNAGKELIKRIFWAKNELQHDIKVAYLENYNMTMGAMITSGVDIWLNTPEPPMEASGTSGMKAALNGVPNLSVLDGWWIEGYIEGLTGWSIGEPVGRFMKKEPVTPSTTVEELVEDFIYRHQFKMFPVVEAGDGLRGCITMKQVKEIPKEKWQSTTAGEIAVGCSADNTVDSKADAMEALAQMTRTGSSRLMVTEDNRLAGIISLKDMMKFFELKVELEP